MTLSWLSLVAINCTAANGKTELHGDDADDKRMWLERRCDANAIRDAVAI